MGALRFPRAARAAVLKIMPSAAGGLGRLIWEKAMAFFSVLTGCPLSCKLWKRSQNISAGTSFKSQTALHLKSQAHQEKYWDAAALNITTVCLSAPAYHRKTKAGSTQRSSRAVPHPSTNRALRRLTSEVGRDPVHSTRYGRQRCCCQNLIA